jgi:3'-phosphoadenosine 5'-phosphosulfate sulfotransferase (PAPS reductase)/FAD synthetase
MVRWCSVVLKIDAFALALNNEPVFVGAKLLVLTGERRQESAGRARYAEREPHRCDSGRKRVDAWRAVIDWSEERVWDSLRRHRIQPHPAYRLGFPRVSCLSCIFADTNQWASIRKIAPDMFNRILGLERQFNCTITKGRDVEQMADRGTPYPETDDVELVRLAMSHTEAPQVMLADSEPWRLPGGAYRHGGGPT